MSEDFLTCIETIVYKFCYGNIEIKNRLIYLLDVLIHQTFYSKISSCPVPLTYFRHTPSQSSTNHSYSIGENKKTDHSKRNDQIQSFTNELNQLFVLFSFFVNLLAHWMSCKCFLFLLLLLFFWTNKRSVVHFCPSVHHHRPYVFF